MLNVHFGSVLESELRQKQKYVKDTYMLKVVSSEQKLGVKGFKLQEYEQH